MQILQSSSFVDAMLALPLLRSLNAFYPNFDHWYISKVVPGIVLGGDKMLLAKEKGAIVGVALGKVTSTETKLRCIRVLPEFQHRGTGIRLLDSMIEVLEQTHPHCSVSEEMLHLYSRAFVTRYGFQLTDVQKGAYRRNVLEYYFN